MRLPLSRLGWIALGLLPLAWMATNATQFRTRVEIETDGHVITLSVNGQKVSAPGEMGRLRAIAIAAYPTLSPSGCENLAYGLVNGPLQKLAAPKEFIFPAHAPLLSDWWIDRGAQQSEVYRVNVDGDRSAKVVATLTGRTLGGVELVLEGDQRISGFFRAGHINNDLGITVSRHTVMAQALGDHVKLDLPHLLHPIFAALTAALALMVVFNGIGRVFSRPGAGINFTRAGQVLAAITIVAGFAGCLWTAWSVLGARPHFQDDLAYLLRAKWMLAGHLSLPEPPNAEHFSIPFTFVSKGQWIVQYPIGWSALLALGEAFRSAWVIAPLCALVLGFLTWKLGVECGGPAAGLIAALLGALSPLALLLGGSMLSHTAAAMWEALFLWLYLRGWDSQRHGAKLLALAGVALGLAFTTRPLPPVAIALPAGIYGLVEMWRGRFRGGVWVKLAAILLGGVVGSLPQLFDNAMVTGSPLVFAYTAVANVHWSFRHFPEGIFWGDRTLAQLPGGAFGWGGPIAAGSVVILALTLAFALVPFLSGRANRKDWLLLAAGVAVPLSYMGHAGGSSLHGFGPRYYADVFFILFVLTGRGFQVLAEIGAGTWAARGLAAALLLFLTIPAGLNLPKRLALYRSYNEVDDRTDRILAKRGISRGLVLFSEPVYLQWIRLAPRIPVDLKADLVFAERRENNQALLKAYAGYPVYFLHDGDVTPYTEPTSP